MGDARVSDTLQHGRRYATLVVDPPWPIKDSGDRTASDKGFWAGRLDGAAKVPYRIMSLADIAALPVSGLAEPNAHLYLWAINQYLPEAYGIIQAWGFTRSTLLTWCKAPRGIGFGGTFTSTTEFVLFARRGSLKALRRWDRSHFEWKRPYEGGYPAHSKKPDGLQDVIEITSPGPYLEMFARSQRLGWESWGLECLNHVTIESSK
jgi:N6-adenosine-specific RNA methylase IME4